MHILILILATWRIASLLAVEAGPWRVFLKFRKAVGVHYDEFDRLVVDENGKPEVDNEFARGIICVWCNSLWIGLASVGAYYLAPAIVYWLALPFALSAGAVLLSEGIGWLEHRP